MWSKWRIWYWARIRSNSSTKSHQISTYIWLFFLHCVFSNVSSHFSAEQEIGSTSSTKIHQSDIQLAQYSFFTRRMERERQKEACLVENIFHQSKQNNPMLIVDLYSHWWLMKATARKHHVCNGSICNQIFCSESKLSSNVYSATVSLTLLIFWSGLRWYCSEPFTGAATSTLLISCHSP